MRDTQRKGDIGVTQAIATFTRLGFDVALPVTESAAYDILVDDGLGVHRVQVRYCSGVEVELRRIHSNSKGYVIKKTRAKAYLIKECLESRRSIRPQDTHLLRSAAIE